MAKRINKNVIIGLAGLGFVITTAVGIFLVTALKQDDPTEFEKRAIAFKEQKDWQRAEQFYLRAYQVSNDPIYLVHTGNMLYQRGREIKALEAYRNAVMVNPKLLDAQEKILDLRLELTEFGGGTEVWEDAQKTAEAILEIQSENDYFSDDCNSNGTVDEDEISNGSAADINENLIPDECEHARALYAIGSAYIHLKELDPSYEELGVKYLKQAISNDPQSVEFTGALGEYYTQINEPQKAEQVLKALVDRTLEPGKNATEARCRYTNFLGIAKRYDDAVKVLDDALKLTGDDPDVQEMAYVRYGRYWINQWYINSRELETSIEESQKPSLEQKKQEAYDNAIAMFTKAIEIAPEKFESYLYLGKFHEMCGDTKEAINTYKKRLALPFNREGFKAFESRHNRYALLLGLSNLYITLAAAEEPGTAKQDEYLTEANMYTEDALGEYPNRPETLHTSGKIEYIRGNPREAVKYFEQAAKQGNIIDSKNLYYLAATRLQLGDAGAAEEAIVQALSSPTATLDCWVMYSKVLLRLQKPKEALAAINKVLTVAPANTTALVIKAAAQEQLGQDHLADKTLQEIKSDNPATISAQAKMLARQGDTDKALKTVNEALSRNPADISLVQAAAVIYKNLGQTSKAMEVVNAALKQKPNEFDLELLKLKLEDLPQEEQEKEYLKLLNGIEDEYLRAIRMATYYESKQEWKKQYEQLSIAKDHATNRSTKAAREAGGDKFQALFDGMFQAAIALKDDTKIDALTEEAAAFNEGNGIDGAQGLSYRGWRLIVNGFNAKEKAIEAAQKGNKEDAINFNKEAISDFNEAIAAYEQALDLYPSSGRMWARLGQVYRLTNRTNEAHIAYKRSYELQPNNPFALKQLVELSESMGNDEERKTWLEKCQIFFPDDPWVIEQLLVQDETDKPREGIARRENLRTENPKDVRNLIKLTELYTKIGDIEKAKEVIDEILLLETNTPEQALAYSKAAAELLRNLGDPDQALSVLKKAMRDAPKELKASAQLLIGDHYAALRLRQADNEYLAAADIDPNEKVCKAIGSYFLQTGRYAQAKEWLEKAYSLAVESNSFDLDIITQMRIETSMYLRDLDSAESLCDEYLAKKPKDSAGMFLNAQIQAARGNTDKAIEKLSVILETNTNHPLALFRRAQYLASLSRWQDCITDLQNLKASNPTALRFRPRILLAEAYRQVGRLDMSFQELENLHAEHPDVDEVTRTLIQSYTASAASDPDKAGSYYAKADQVLSTQLNSNPNNVEWLISSGEVAIKQKDRSKALANFKRAAESSGYNPVICTKLMQACSQLGSYQVGIDFYENSIPPDRRTPDVMLPYAELLAKRGDTDSAVNTLRSALYRQGYSSFDFLSKLTINAMSSFPAGKSVELFSKEPENEIFARANKHIYSLVLQASQKSDESLKLLAELFDSSTDEAEKNNILTRQAMMYEVKGELEKSKNAYEQVLTTENGNLIALNNLAYLLADKLNQPEAAVPYAKQAVQISKTPAVIDTLGWAYLQTGQYLEAIARLTEAREIDPNYVPCAFHLAEAYRKNGQFQNARQLFNDVLRSPATLENKEYIEQAGALLEKANNNESD